MFRVFRSRLTAERKAGSHQGRRNVSVADETKTLSLILPIPHLPAIFSTWYIQALSENEEQCGIEMRHTDARSAFSWCYLTFASMLHT